MDISTYSKRNMDSVIQLVAFFVLFLLVSSITWAEPNRMFELTGINADAARMSADKIQSSNIDRLTSQPNVKGFEAAQLRAGFVGSLKANDNLSVNIFGKDIILTVKDRQNRGTATIIHAGNPDTGDNMTLYSQDNDLAGTVREGNNLYNLQSLGNNLIGITLIDESQLQEHDIDYPTGAMSPAEGKPQLQNKNDTDSLSSLLSDSGDVIRVMVAYTSAASAAVTNINTTIALAIAETNQSYTNSGINTRVELAHSYLTAYTETGNMSTDLSRFRTPNDGYMDEVQALRNTHAADVVIYMGSNSYGYCGLASTIMATEANAYAAVRISCATGYYSFGHEIGHLQGARHIITNDPSTTPFAYGHGYCQPGVSFGWRTVMAYGCPNGDGTRIPYWSNPSRTYGGVAMGVAGESNNARVLNETAFTVANFRTSATPWTVGYDWSCDGSYNKAEFALNDDRTFTTGTYNGTWVENHNMIDMTFSGGTKYVGRHQGKSMTGKMRSAGNLTGCWYAHPNDGFNYDVLYDINSQTPNTETSNVIGN